MLLFIACRLSSVPTGMCIFDDIRMHRATLFGDSHGAQPQACEELSLIHI